MHRAVSSKAHQFVSRLYTSASRTSALLRRTDALAPTRPSISNGLCPTRVNFFSSIEKMNSTGENPDPLNYTSGRWLRRDVLQRESRTISFDFDALRRKVIELCPGANSITSYSKKEGGFNRVFIFHTDNEKRLVARLPFPVAGPQRLVTSSEVATIQFLQANTSIPISRILDWSDDASNTIGSEYILMEHAPGISLHERWPTMGIGDQIRCIQSISQKLKELVDLEFPAYGSLYFANTPYIAGQELPFNQDFAVGPHCGTMFWGCNVGQPRYSHNVDPNQGPWLDFAAYCGGLIDTGITRLPPVDTYPQRSLLGKLAMDPRFQRAAVPVMIHPDLHKRNIFVSEEDPNVISAIIDWQSSSIEPAFWYADEVPDFAQPCPDPLDKDRTEPKSEACAKAFDAYVRLLAPKLATARSIDANLFRPFRYCYRTWEDGIVAFREELIQTSLHWKELGLKGSCPYPLPGPDDLLHHQKDCKQFEAAQQLTHSLSSLLNTASDGWVPSEAWEATEVAHQELFKGMLQEVLGNVTSDDDEPIKNEDDLREIWPFDLE
ncbi:kinase-like domain-containing protein [Paraphoma chrysanthemicola]|uniref:Altered inheritance of mitochondria protein 9, mitochondrial n=1 Tax=Paraphoma chrysanthemicola TaxID=798071 RepID=A0A8K0RCK9_9PLEO|nr:kinase-like domain-containing protein [Paraphoma chrysanthemicola]